MEEVRNIRINKVLRQLNISLIKAIDFLSENGIEIIANPNSKISETEYELLIKQFFKKPKPIQLIEDEFDFRIDLRKDMEDSTKGIELTNFYTLHEDGNIKGLNLKIDELVFDIKSKEDFLNQIKNLFFIIKGLPKLIALELPNNEFLEYSEIGELTNLKHLDLSDNQLKDVSFLENLIELEYLNLSRNKIKNISSLKRLTKLKDLVLNENEIENISSLKNLKVLVNLNLSSNFISNINVFKFFKIFDFLDLSNNKITDISALKSISISNELWLGQNNIIDLTPLYYSLKYDKINFINKYENLLRYPPIQFEMSTEREVYRWFENNLENARERIKECKKDEDKKLDLGNCGLTDLSLLPELFEKNYHIEELILSNHYAMYDNNNWNKIESNGINPNNISFIPNTISNLKVLKVLIVGGDWKQGKEWNRWRLKNVTNLMKLSGLRVLNISNNQIEKLIGLNDLVNLESLYANNNELKKVDNLGGFENLKEIYLSNNKLTDISFLKDLVNIQTIDLHSNDIKDLSILQNLIERIGITNGKWNINTINVKDNALDEIFINIINNNNLLERKINIENYFERLKQGESIVIKRIKLIILGNTHAGKTTLADILSNEKKSNEGSTHGVNFFKYKIGEVEINGYDFGGQDYYHNTHYSFFDKKAVYFIICGNEQKDILAVKNDEMLFPLSYWLGSLNKFAYENVLESFYNFFKILSNFEGLDMSAVNNLLKQNNLEFVYVDNNLQIKNHIRQSNVSIKMFLKYTKSFIKDLNLIQNHADFSYFNNFTFKAFVYQNIYLTKLWFDELSIKNKYSFLTDFNFSNFKIDTSNTEKIFNENLKNIALDKNFKIETQLNKIDYEIAEKFQENKDKIILNINDIRNLDTRIKKYNDSQIHSLLTDLHGILVCYYFEMTNKKEHINDNLENIIIVNIEKFTEWIYQILDHRINIDESNFKIGNKNLLKREGYFTRADAKICLSEELAIKNLDYILAFMLEHKLIFKMKDNDCFFVPNHLTDNQTRTEKLFLNSFQKPVVKYEFNEYFHTSILSEIISEYFNNLVIEENKIKYVLWKNKVLLYETDHNRIVYISFIIDEEKPPMITISKFNNLVSDDFILKICKFIEIKINSYDYDKFILSSKGNYVPYEVLNANNQTEELKKNKFYFLRKYNLQKVRLQNVFN